MDGACGFCGGRDAYRVLVGRPEVLDIFMRIMLKWTSKKQEGNVDWFGLFQDMDKWRAFVSTVMNLLNQ
jgi:hypothetical protein